MKASSSPQTIIAAADGSALGNPGPAGWAWYVDADRWAAGGWEHGTNNMGELKAVLDLFEATAHLPQAHLQIICDSKYVIDSLTKWMPGWKKKGWKKSNGKPVLNLDLLQALDKAMDGRSYSFEWVKGHSGHPLNEAADQLANGAAKSYQAGEGPEAGPGYKDQPGQKQALTAQRKPAQQKAESSPEPGLEQAPALQKPSPQELEQLILDLEAQTHRPQTYRSEKLLGGLLAPQLTWISGRGRLTQRPAVLEHRALACALKADWPRQQAQFQLLNDHTALVISPVETERGSVWRASTWIQQGESWQLVHRQDTPTGPQA